jgi:hypothetical protein
LLHALAVYVFNVSNITSGGFTVTATSTSFDYIIPIVAAIISAGIGGGIAWVVHRSQSQLQKISADQQMETAENQKKQLRLSSILEAFKILNSNEHRNARESVYCAYHLYHKKNRTDIFEREPYRKNAAMVRADMDQMGMLIDEELIDKDTFLKAYWNTVLVCWKALEEDVKRERKVRKYESYMTYFSKLNDLAKEYRDYYKLGTKETYVFSDDDCDAKFTKPIRDD